MKTCALESSMYVAKSTTSLALTVRLVTGIQPEDVRRGAAGGKRAELTSLMLN